MTECAIAALGLINDRYDMDILDVSPLSWTTRVMDFSQTSLNNTLGTVKEVHQTMVEIPINVAQELGMSEQTSAALKYTHRKDRKSNRTR